MTLKSGSKSLKNLEMEEESERHRISAKEEMKVMKETNESMVKYIRKREGNANMH